MLKGGPVEEEDAEEDDEELRRRDLAEDIRPWNGTDIYFELGINQNQ